MALYRHISESSMEAQVLPSKIHIASKYMIFACVAGAINILSQIVTISILERTSSNYQVSYHLTAALVIGTIAGLLPKYVFDSIWIFPDQAVHAEYKRQHARTLTLYAFTALITTSIFWVCEYAFNAFIGGDWRYAGAFIGLLIGYRVKYLLDQRFVFGSNAT